MRARCALDPELTRAPLALRAVPSLRAPILETLPAGSLIYRCQRLPPWQAILLVPPPDPPDCPFRGTDEPACPLGWVREGG